MLRGRYANRMCVLNYTTTREDMLGVLDWFEREPRPQVVRVEEAQWDERGRIAPRRGWLAPPDQLAEALEAVPLLRPLDGEQLALLLSAGTRRDVPAGETIVAQWEDSRELYLILAGRVEVQIDGRHVRTMGRGEFFGELAALDWGASYGYPRLATVTAQTQVRLFAIPAPTLNQLMREVPALDQEIRRVVRSRLYNPVET
jgi:hypothetical protein